MRVEGACRHAHRHTCTHTQRTRGTHPRANTHSPPPRQVLGTVKNVLLVVAAMFLYGEVVTGLQAWGYLVASVAFGHYTYIKARAIAAGA